MPGNLKVQRGQMADGTINEYEVAGPVELRFKNRRTAVNAMVLSGNNEVLLGAIPMEDMDVLIHPLRQELIVNSDPPLFCSNEVKIIRNTCLPEIAEMPGRRAFPFINNFQK